MAFFDETLLDQQIEKFRDQDLYNFAWVADNILQNDIHSSLVKQLKENVPIQEESQNVTKYDSEPLITIPKTLLPTIRNIYYYVGEWGMWDNQIYYWNRKEGQCRYELSQYN